jgi:hypothetical protein
MTGFLVVDCILPLGLKSELTLASLQPSRSPLTYKRFGLVLSQPLVCALSFSALAFEGMPTVDSPEGGKKRGHSLVKWSAVTKRDVMLGRPQSPVTYHPKAVWCQSEAWISIHCHTNIRSLQVSQMY